MQVILSYVCNVNGFIWFNSPEQGKKLSIQSVCEEQPYEVEDDTFN